VEYSFNFPYFTDGVLIVAYKPNTTSLLFWEFLGKQSSGLINMKKLFSLFLFISVPVITSAETPVTGSEPPAAEQQLLTKPQGETESAKKEDEEKHSNESKKPSHLHSARKNGDEEKAAEQKEPTQPKTETPRSPAYAAAARDPEVVELEKNKQLLILKNTMEEERLRDENSDILLEVQRLRWEKELLLEQIEVEQLKKEIAEQEAYDKHNDTLEKLTRESELASAREARLISELSSQRTQWELKNAKLQAEMDAISVKEQHNAFAIKEPVYLENPVTEDGTLVVSDRRIELDGPILHETANHLTDRINYYNNKDNTLPIFLVIDSSPGGSAMAGYKIMRAIDASEAPIYVVVKSFAASMAAIITTTAERSYAYPNAIIMHHQPIATIFLASLNMTEQKEFYENSKKWWELMMGPVAKKMGVSNDELIDLMYENASDGDWSEFATEAQKLKWVDHLVDNIHETDILIDPDAVAQQEQHEPQETLTHEGRTVMYLPRLNPKDPYFIYNPDRYYQVR
jgi:ATP-dependent Clp protease protease subunit